MLNRQILQHGQQRPSANDHDAKTVHAYNYIKDNKALLQLSGQTQMALEI